MITSIYIYGGTVVKKGVFTPSTYKIEPSVETPTEHAQKSRSVLYAYALYTVLNFFYRHAFQYPPCI